MILIWGGGSGLKKARESLAPEFGGSLNSEVSHREMNLQVLICTSAEE